MRLGETLRMSDRPFRILGVQQIAVGGESKDRLRKLWVDLLGLEVQGTFRSEKENVDEDIVKLGSGAHENAAWCRGHQGASCLGWGPY